MCGKNMRMHEGLVDAHVHIQRADGLSVVAASGVAAVRDAGTKHGAGLSTGIQDRGGTGQTVLSAGWALFKTGGYGSAFGIPADCPEDILNEIHKLKTRGARIIKAMGSGMVSLKNPGTVTPGGFGPDELVFMVKEAAAVGLGVMAHANGEQAIIAAAVAGVRSIEHGFFMTKHALELMARRKVFWVPTVGALRRAAGPGNIAKEAAGFIAGLIRSHLDLIWYAHAIGVPLAVGTDCVLPDPDYSAAYEAELAYFEHAGIPRDKVMKIACEGGARLLGL